MSQVILKNPNDLKQHPMNVKIYGNEEMDLTLMASIKTEGILNPVVIRPDNVILSGTRRNEIAKKLGIEVPCIIKSFDSEAEEVMAIISFNRARSKTYIQEMNEVDIYENSRKEQNLPVSNAQTAEAHNASKGTFHRKRQLWETAKKEVKTKQDEAEKQTAKKLIDKLATDPAFTPTKAYDRLLEHRNSEKIRIVREEASEVGGKLEDTEMLYLGDFTKVLDFIPDGSVDVILTDPPYPIEFIDCWLELGKFAEKKLRPGGWLVAYSGQRNLPLIYSKLAESTLKYYWQMALYHNGTRQDVWGVTLNVMWKPILVYAKEPVTKIEIPQRGDYLISEKEEKDGHVWQQSESSIRNLLITYSREGDLIVDPFAGSGTTLDVARAMKRKTIGAEIDIDSYNIAKARLSKKEVLIKEQTKMQSFLGV